MAQILLNCRGKKLLSDKEREYYGPGVPWDVAKELYPESPTNFVAIVQTGSQVKVWYDNSWIKMIRLVNYEALNETCLTKRIVLAAVKYNKSVKDNNIQWEKIT